MISKKSKNYLLPIMAIISFILIILIIVFGVFNNNLTKQINELSLKNIDLNKQLNLNNELYSKTIIDYDNNLLKEINLNDAFKNYLYDNSELTKKEFILSEDLEDINTILNYNTCKAYSEKLEDYYNIINQKEELYLNFINNYQEYSKNKVCSDKLNNLKIQSEEIIKLRSEYLDAITNWCYGYHKIDWSNTWEEKYLMPENKAADKLNKKISENTEFGIELTKTCFSN